MNLRLFIVVMALMVFVTACEETYIGDVVHPLIPAYTEEGMNDAGAFINGLPWRSSPYQENLDPDVERAYIWFVDSIGVTSMRIPTGRIVEPGLMDPRGYQITFELNRNILQEFEQHKTLPIAVALNGIDGYGALSDTLYEETANCISHDGMLYIRNIQTYDQNNITISGTFGFEVANQCGDFRVTSGRFDFVFLTQQY
jgi:hypothetical protein